LAITEGARVVRIVAVTVAYESDAPTDLQPVLVGLADMREHCRAERVDDLLDDLFMLCEDIQAARLTPGPVLSLVRKVR
jgi:hypothetical protein